MSVTALQMITDALVLSNVNELGRDPSAEQGAGGLRTLNQMMGQWDRDGIQLGWFVIPTLATTLPLDLQDEKAVLFNLALEFAGQEGIEPTAYVTREAKRTFAALAKAKRKRNECQLDHLPQPSANYGLRSIETG